MPRTARTVFAGIPHHVTQRGNRRASVFFSDLDRATYLGWLGEYCQRHDVLVLAYCLMPNHVHAVVVPARPDGLERVLKPLHMRYAQRINRQRGWKGHFWQGRYFSAAMDEAHTWTAIRYVERNPVRAGIAARAEAYAWSSAAAHCGLRADPLLAGTAPWLAEFSSGPWSDWLAGVEAPGDLKAMRKSVQTGFPCGNQAFIERLERLANRSLRPRPPGRQRKGRGGDGSGNGEASPFEIGKRPLFHQGL